MAGQFSAGHGHKRPAHAVDDLQVTHYKTIVKRDRTKSLQAVTRTVHKLDMDFGSLHDRAPCCCRSYEVQSDGEQMLAALNT